MKFPLHFFLNMEILPHGMVSAIYLRFRRGSCKIRFFVILNEVKDLNLL